MSSAVIDSPTLATCSMAGARNVDRPTRGCTPGSRGEFSVRDTIQTEFLTQLINRIFKCSCVSLASLSGDVTFICDIVTSPIVMNILNTSR